jgi:hypothetical protein
MPPDQFVNLNSDHFRTFRGSETNVRYPRIAIQSGPAALGQFTPSLVWLPLLFA